MRTAIFAVALLCATPAAALDVWLAADPHVCNVSVPAASRPWCDRYQGIRSLQRGIEQSKAITDWDIGLVLGDFGMENTAAEGAEVVSQFSALGAARETVYTLAGNHDATCSDGNVWFRKYVDPLGEFTDTSGVTRADYPYPIVTSGGGTWANYYFDVGNVRFIMMSDRNWTDLPVGRCPSTQGYPTGGIAGSVFAWLEDLIEENEALPEPRILIIAHHHMLQDTTAGSCQWCGRTAFSVGLPNWKGTDPATVEYHGVNGSGAIAGQACEGATTRGASYLYYIDATPVTGEFAALLSACSSCALWIGGHTHLTGPDATMYGAGACVEKYGMAHCNVAALTTWWSGYQSMSRILELTPSSSTATLRYILHTPLGGIVHGRTDTIDLKRAFQP